MTFHPFFSTRSPFFSPTHSLIPTLYVFHTPATLSLISIPYPSSFLITLISIPSIFIMSFFLVPLSLYNFQYFLPFLRIFSYTTVFLYHFFLFYVLLFYFLYFTFFLPWFPWNNKQFLIYIHIFCISIMIYHIL